MGVDAREDVLHRGPTNPALVLRALRRYRDRPAFVSDEETITYGAVESFIGRAQTVLATEGVRPGECIASLSRNGAEAWLVSVAAHAMGLTTTNLHPMGSLEDHLRHIRAADVHWVVVDARSFAARGAEIAAAGVARILVLGPADYAKDLLARIEAAGAATPRDVSDPTAVAGFHFTGGTTGAPKQIYQTHRRTAAGTLAFSANMEMPATPRLLAAGPITHVTGALLIPTLLRGGSVHMLKGFDIERMIEVIKRDRINTTLLVPTMIYALLDSPFMARADFSSLELLLYSASPMSPQRLIEAIERIGPVFAQIYAQSECGPITYMPKADHTASRPEIFSACGFPVPECAIRLVDNEDQDVKPGEPGEICVRATHAFNGYRNNEEATAEALRDGWLHTGDIARADDEGRLYVVDRKKDMIVTGGFNVYAREVEDAIAAHPGVASAAVIGVPDERWGEAVCAYVVARPGAVLSAETVAETVKALKGSVHAPKIVRVVDALPLTPLGKIDKKPLREAAWASTARKVN